MLCTYCGGEYCDNLACRGWEDRLYYETIIPQEEPKQETLEEAAANLADPNLCKTDNWISGAKWQAERMYREEELKSAFRTGFGIGYGSDIYAIDVKDKICDEWFEQFKKK